MTLVFDTPEGIAFYRLCAVRARCKLELQGLRSRRSSYAAAKRIYGLKGSRQRVVDQLDTLIEEAHEQNQKAALLAAEPAGHA